MTGRIRPVLLLTAAIFLVPALGQAQGDSSLGLGAVPPDFAELFRLRPPMGACPVGETDDPGRLPEGSHLLHLGVGSFYLPHRGRLRLSPEQRDRLRLLRDAATDAWRSGEAAIERQELELWELTGASPPPAAAIEAKVEEIERSRTAQRLDYIQAVREASSILSEEQQRALTGQAAPPTPAR